MEVQMILKHSPFKTEEALQEQFRRIESNSGTLAIIYNLKLLDDGRTELGKIKIDNLILKTISELNMYLAYMLRSNKRSV